MDKGRMQRKLALLLRIVSCRQVVLLDAIWRWFLFKRSNLQFLQLGYHQSLPSRFTAATVGSSWNPLFGLSAISDLQVIYPEGCQNVVATLCKTC